MSCVYHLPYIYIYSYTSYTSYSMFSAEETNSENNTYDQYPRVYYQQYDFYKVNYVKNCVKQELIILCYTDSIFSDNKIVYFCGVFFSGALILRVHKAVLTGEQHNFVTEWKILETEQLIKDEWNQGGLMLQLKAALERLGTHLAFQKAW